MKCRRYMRLITSTSVTGSCGMIVCYRSICASVNNDCSIDQNIQIWWQKQEVWKQWNRVQTLKFGSYLSHWFSWFDHGKVMEFYLTWGTGTLYYITLSFFLGGMILLFWIHDSLVLVWLTPSHRARERTLCDSAKQVSIIKIGVKYM